MTITRKPRPRGVKRPTPPPRRRKPATQADRRHAITAQAVWSPWLALHEETMPAADDWHIAAVDAAARCSPTHRAYARMWLALTATWSPIIPASEIDITLATSRIRQEREAKARIERHNNRVRSLAKSLGASVEDSGEDIAYTVKVSYRGTKGSGRGSRLLKWTCSGVHPRTCRPIRYAGTDLAAYCTRCHSTYTLCEDSLPATSVHHSNPATLAAATSGAATQANLAAYYSADDDIPF